MAYQFLACFPICKMGLSGIFPIEFFVYLQVLPEYSQQHTVELLLLLFHGYSCRHYHGRRNGMWFDKENFLWGPKVIRICCTCPPARCRPLEEKKWWNPLTTQSRGAGALSDRHKQLGRAFHRWRTHCRSLDWCHQKVRRSLDRPAGERCGAAFSLAMVLSRWPVAFADCLAHQVPPAIPQTPTSRDWILKPSADKVPWENQI